MAETAQTIIKLALKDIGAIAVGETPTADEEADALSTMKMMFRHWAAKNIRMFFSTVEGPFVLTGAGEYTIGSGGTFNTVRPLTIKYALSESYPETFIPTLSEGEMANGKSGMAYNPTYPLGTIYITSDLDSGNLYLLSFKPLAEPAGIASDVLLPDEYIEAIRYGLAVRLAPMFGKSAPAEVISLAKGGLNDLETRHFADMVNPVASEVIKISRRYNINNDI